MTDDTCSQAGAPLDGSRLTADQAPGRVACSAVTQPHQPAARVTGKAIAELLQLGALAVAHVAADPGPVVTITTACQWAAEARTAGFGDGWDAGRLDLIADEKRAQMGIVRALRDSAPDQNPWHLCCRPCRLGGHKHGCPSCSDRTRQTFGEPHPDDYRGRDGAA